MDIGHSDSLIIVVKVLEQNAISVYLFDKENLFGRLFKTFSGKAQKKFKADAYFFIREGLNFLQQRSHRVFFNCLPKGHCNRGGIQLLALGETLHEK